MQLTYPSFTRSIRMSDPLFVNTPASNSCLKAEIKLTVNVKSCTADGRRSHWSVRSILLCWLLILTSSCSTSAAETFNQTSCRGGECVWSSISEPFLIKKNDNGSLVAVSTRSCVERSNRFPSTYDCRKSEVLKSDTIAFCSTKSPSIATRTGNGEWQRMRLSIASNEEYGYNRQSITDYLKICHGFIRGLGGVPSLDAIGARLGYRSRTFSIENDTVKDAIDLIE